VPQASQHFQVVIVGAGFSGIGAAIRLKQAGFHDLVLCERASDVGGVWRDNSYPGAACDVESHLYSYSFAPNPRWSHAFSRQPEILAYLRDCAARFDVRRYVRFDHAVLGARWDDAQQRWLIETNHGPLSADFLVCAVGLLSEPRLPDVPGLECFQGRVFHSARWDHDFDVTGKRVGVIGTGASAVQFVPEIQPRVQQLTLFQRTPAWVLPRWDELFSERRKAWLSALPALQKLVRASIYVRRELLILGFRHPTIMRLVERTARSYLERTIADPELRAKLTPDFRIGCKRVLITGDYLPALTQKNVSIVTSPIREVRAHSIVAADGSEHALDAIIYGTGFHVMDVPFGDCVRGKGGRTLNQVWNGSPSAHLATTVAGFPNLFFLMGPATGLGHTSVLLMLESQLRVLVPALEHMRDKKLRVIEVRKDVQQRFFETLQHDARGTVWTEGGCASWYLDRNGKATSLWPRSTWAFMRRAQFRAADYALTREPAQAVAAE
jgi:cation diffusion facilitator CzcD-associated flavoprotein CzcO